MRESIRFVFRSNVHEISSFSPDETVLDFLREEKRATGTKEGCAEGDCGACTVVLGEMVENEIRYRAVNSCILFLGTLHGKLVLTVEDFRVPAGPLHPVQESMVDEHGSQCGFCTPGFITSLYALYKTEKNPPRKSIEDALVGNLCRCTGYRPILDAADKMYSIAENPLFQERELAWENALRELNQDLDLEIFHEKEEEGFFAPTSLEELLKLRLLYEDAYLLAGGTDLGLYVTKRKMKLGRVIHLQHVKELQVLKEESDHVKIGAAVSYSDALPLIQKHFPALNELVLRLGSRQIRNLGTIGGNLANASPIGDSPPSLIVLNARVVLSGPSGQRTLPLHEFFIDYRKTNLKPDEVLESIEIPFLEEGDKYQVYKLSKRFDQDISSVCGAFFLKLEQGRVQDIRICFGGMAATPKLASETMSFLMGKEWNESTIETAMELLQKEYQPMSDFRGSSEYRRIAAANLLKKFYLESLGEDVNLGVLE